MVVDALTGNLDDVVRNGERFRVGWERAGRPAASDLAEAAYAVAMVHGMRGDDERRAEWLRIMAELGIDAGTTDRMRDGLGADLRRHPGAHRDDPGSARATRSLPTSMTRRRGTWSSMLWRPWYAALWAEAAVLADALTPRRLHRAQPPRRPQQPACE